MIEQFQCQLILIPLLEVLATNDHSFYEKVILKPQA